METLNQPAETTNPNESELGTLKQISQSLTDLANGLARYIENADTIAALEQQLKDLQAQVADIEAKHQQP